jgi:hypothetical protein
MGTELSLNYIFSIDFNSMSLINECIRTIDDRLKIARGRLTYTKVKVGIDVGGVNASEKQTQK